MNDQVLGINSLCLQGNLLFPQMRYLPNSNKALLKGKFQIPVGNPAEGQTAQLSVIAWEDVAEALTQVPTDAWIRVDAEIRNRLYKNREGRTQDVTELIIKSFEEAPAGEGQNLFLLQGQFLSPDFKLTGARGVPFFRGKMKIPVVSRVDNQIRDTYVKVKAWFETAEQLSSSVVEGSLIQATGHVEENSWKTRDGEPRVSIDSVISSFNLIEGIANA